jgi:hypothetical protein
MIVELTITDHAVRRYIERIIGWPCYTSDDRVYIRKFIEKTGTPKDVVYQMILNDVSPRLPVTIVTNKTRRVIKGETARFLIDGGAVITCYTGDENENED